MAEELEKKRKKTRKRPVPAQLQDAETPPLKKKFVVHVTRPRDVEKGRTNLPIVMMEQEIMEAINENAVVIVCGETGCGKTTQIPQFLFEAGFGSKKCEGREGIIGVTQPRRVAVMSTAKRVAYELNRSLGREVGFQVRHDRKIGENSAIKFMTDGILLREVQADFLLRKYSVIVLDEAHERSLNTDILIGMLSRVVILRQGMYDQQVACQGENGGSSAEPAVAPLKLVIMSATLRVEDFVGNKLLFKIPPPVIQVPARQYPVTVHFSKKTELRDYEERAFRKVAAIHKKLPAGGILVFLTGQREVESLCSRLRKSFRRNRRRKLEASSGPVDRETDGAASNDCPSSEPQINDLELEAISKAVDGEGERFHGALDHFEDDADAKDRLETSELRAEHLSDDGKYSEVSDIDGDDSDDDDEASPCFILNSTLLSGLDKLTQVDKDAVPPVSNGLDSRNGTASVSTDNAKELMEPGPLYVLPLYAMLPAVAQLRVFSAVPKGMRLVVVATNVAETSITIPGIRYVVDSGRAKAKDFDRSSGISKYEVQWISKASADQRAGRAGRTGPGHCYRLYSSAHFNDTFPQFSPPEITKAPIEGVVLLMKHMGIDKVLNFPFPSPPERMSLVEAERCLKALSALDQSTGSLTPMGRAMAVYPVSPRHSRMLLAALEAAQSLQQSGQTSTASLFLSCAVAVVAALSLESPLLKDGFLAFGSDHLSLHGDEVVNNGEESGTSPANAGDADAKAQRDAQEKAERKLRRSAVNAAHAKFWNGQSDALCTVKALHAYEKCDDAEGFCRAHFLHERNMLEMSKLRQQLVRLVIHFSPETGVEQEVVDCLAGSEICWQQPVLTLDLKLEGLLCKAICTGWADRVARKLGPQERARVQQEGKPRKGGMYQACMVEDEVVYIHPSSSVSKGAPDYVVYTDIVHTSRPYMCGVTAIQGEWLVSQAGPLCTFSKPVADPPPWYDSISDQIMCWVSPSFGPHLWQLPLHAFPMKSGRLRIAVFAAALLQGKVLPCMSEIRPYLSADPSIIFKPESMAHKRVGELIYKLGSGSSTVCSRGLLAAAWDMDPQFLKLELQSWVQSLHSQKLDHLWEKMRNEAKLDGASLAKSKRRVSKKKA